MEIIAHRGLWTNWIERNQKEAFVKSKEDGLGTETDFRDYRGELVISHNVADDKCLKADEFFKLYEGTSKTLALNIKADGIQELLRDFIVKYNIKNYFCFDMSIPDTLLYPEYDLEFFVRESEYETINDLYSLAAGVWLDAFKSDEWITRELIQKHRSNRKRVCIVSPELHKGDYMGLWERLKDQQILKDTGVILCTDYPNRARAFFYGKD